MVKCTFCGEVLKPGTGKMFVQKEGKVLYFCGSKCEKNMLNLKRKPITTRWSKRYEKRGKRKDE
ncbi:MAG: 50S ribosomal protein L24e [Nanoarchaeota archaeon]